MCTPSCGHEAVWLFDGRVLHHPHMHPVPSPVLDGPHASQHVRSPPRYVSMRVKSDQRPTTIALLTRVTTSHPRVQLYTRPHAKQHTTPAIQRQEINLPAHLHRCRPPRRGPPPPCPAAPPIPPRPLDLVHGSRANRTDSRIRINRLVPPLLLDQQKLIIPR